MIKSQRKRSIHFHLYHCGQNVPRQLLLYFLVVEYPTGCVTFNWNKKKNSSTNSSPKRLKGLDKRPYLRSIRSDKIWKKVSYPTSWVISRKGSLLWIEDNGRNSKPLLEIIKDKPRTTWGSLDTDLNYPHKITVFMNNQCPFNKLSLGY